MYVSNIQLYVNGIHSYSRVGTATGRAPRDFGTTKVRSVPKTLSSAAIHDGWSASSSSGCMLSRLVLGWSGGRALHVVAADDPDSDLTIVITVYHTDPAIWSPDFRSRR